MTEFTESGLLEVLGVAQHLGFLGGRPVVDAAEHARAVVRALDEVHGRVVDVGAGGGLPGFVIVHDRPDLAVTLVDRRVKRTDFLERMVRRHGLAGRVEVIGADVELVRRQCVRGDRPLFDAAVARGFGPPEVTLRAMRPLVRPGGVLVVTEPPSGDRWEVSVLDELGVTQRPGRTSVAVFDVA